MLRMLIGWKDVADIGKEREDNIVGIQVWMISTTLTKNELNEKYARSPTYDILIIPWNIGGDVVSYKSLGSPNH